MTAKFSDDAASGDVPIEELPVSAARAQLRVVSTLKFQLGLGFMEKWGEKLGFLWGGGKNEGDDDVRGDVDVADFTAVRFVGFDVDAAVGIPEAEGAVLAAAKAVVAVAVKSDGEDGAFVAL